MWNVPVILLIQIVDLNGRQGFQYMFQYTQIGPIEINGLFWNMQSIRSNIL